MKTKLVYVAMNHFMKVDNLSQVNVNRYYQPMFFLLSKSGIILFILLFVTNIVFASADLPLTSFQSSDATSTDSVLSSNDTLSTTSHAEKSTSTKVPYATSTAKHWLNDSLVILYGGITLAHSTGVASSPFLRVISEAEWEVPFFNRYFDPANQTNGYTILGGFKFFYMQRSFVSDVLVTSTTTASSLTNFDHIGPALFGKVALTMGDFQPYFGLGISFNALLTSNFKETPFEKPFQDFIPEQDPFFMSLTMNLGLQWNKVLLEGYLRAEMTYDIALSNYINGVDAGNRFQVANQSVGNVQFKIGFGIPLFKPRPTTTTTLRPLNPYVDATKATATEVIKDGTSEINISNNIGIKDYDPDRVKNTDITVKDKNGNVVSAGELKDGNVTNFVSDLIKNGKVSAFSSLEIQITITTEEGQQIKLPLIIIETFVLFDKIHFGYKLMLDIIEFEGDTANLTEDSKRYLKIIAQAIGDIRDWRLIINLCVSDIPYGKDAALSRNRSQSIINELSNSGAIITKDMSIASIKKIDRALVPPRGYRVEIIVLQSEGSSK